MGNNTNHKAIYYTVMYMTMLELIGGCVVFMWFVRGINSMSVPAQRGKVVHYRKYKPTQYVDTSLKNCISVENTGRSKDIYPKYH